MGVIRFSIENPVKVAVCVILAVLFGAIALFATPVRLTPEVTEPEITITTVWPGASAREVEREIVEAQEEQLKSVEGMREFKSESSDSVAQIVMKFEVGTDLADARAKVSDKLNQVRQYPQDADEPTITTINPNANAIAWFILKPLPPTADELRTFLAEHQELEPVLAPLLDGRRPITIEKISSLARRHPQMQSLLVAKRDPALMRKFAQDVIEARFERVKGIANANVLGGREVEFRVVVDPARLAAYKVTLVELRAALQRQNKNTSAGDLAEGKLRNVIRTVGQYESPEQVADTIVTLRDNAPIRVRDVATVGIAYRKPDGVVLQKGISSLAINAQQAPETNVLEIMGPKLAALDLNRDGELTQLELSAAKLIYGDCLRIAAAELNIGILRQQGLFLDQVDDQTEYINSATALVQGNIYVGGSLAILILLLFLRSWRSVLIIGLSIPISVIATFLFVRGFGRSINVISLAGMAFAVGMVVDNAIVVLENIFRHYQLGSTPEEASSKGAQEVWGAVLASTLTTLAVFIPVIFVQGQAGQLFRDIAIAISCAVGLSLIVSVTVVPSAARRILRRRDANANAEHAPQPQGRLFGLFGLVDLSTRLTNSFSRGIARILAMRGSLLVRLAIVVFFIAGSLGGALVMMPQTEYLPEGNRNLVIAMLLPPPGYNIDQMISLGEIIDARLAPYWESEPGSPEEAALEGPRIEGFFFVARGRSLFMGARSEDPLRAAELIPVLTRAASDVPGVIPIVAQASLFESSLSGGRTIDIEITGPDLKTLVTEGGNVFGMCMAEFPPVKDGVPTGNQIRPVPSLDLTSPELHVVPRPEMAAELGVAAADLGYTVDALVDGAYAGDYWHEGTKIDLVICGSEDYTQHTHDLANLPIATPTGALVSLSSVADIRLAGGPEQVNHIERQRAITIQLKPGPGTPLETAMNIVNEKVRKPLLSTAAFESGQYQIRLAGTADKLEETRLELQWNLLLALLITYLLMAALFESFFYPLAVMLSVVLALVGGFGGLALLNVFTNQPLDMLTMLGFVILIGTVVNNAILIVHQSLNYMREEGLDDRAAIVESVRTRIRPILMTTLTTLLGMLPLVLPVPSFSSGSLRWVSGAGSELYRGLGSVVLGGLTISTVFTLVLIPVGFSLALDCKRAGMRLLSLLARGDAGSKTVPAPAGMGARAPSGNGQKAGSQERETAAVARKLGPSGEN